MSHQTHENSKWSINDIITMLANHIKIFNQVIAVVSAVTSIKSGMLMGCVNCYLEETFTTEDHTLKASKMEELKSLSKKY